MNPAERRTLFAILIAVAAGLAAGRILAATRVYEPAMTSRWPAKAPRSMPTFGSNDRSRWATIRALVDEGRYVVGRRDLRVTLASATLPLVATNPLEAAVFMQAGCRARIQSDRGIVFEDGWETVDKVLDPTTLQFYSSKPPLLSTLIAGLYWLVQVLTGWLQPNHVGWTLSQNPNEVVRTILLLVNALPFVVYLAVLGRWINRFGGTEWGRLFVFAGACFATLVTPFLNTLNNHTLAVFSVLFALDAVLRIHEKLQQSPELRGTLWHLFVAAGWWASFAVVNELPTLAFAAALFVLLLYWSPVRTLAFFVPPALLLVAAFFYTNYLALGQWQIAYSQTQSVWYQYEGSHWWRPDADTVRRGIDFAKYRETWPEYALHLLIGHHGFFSLTPIWIVAIAGAVASIGRLLRTSKEPDPAAAMGAPWYLAPLTLAVTLVVVAFYLSRPERNYGGFSVGPRWLIWLTPLLLLCMIPAADWLARRRWTRGLGLVCLAVSALSAQYPGWNPWRMPWLYDVMEKLGWITY